MNQIICSLQHNWISPPFHQNSSEINWFNRTNFAAIELKVINLINYRRQRTHTNNYFNCQQHGTF